MSGKTFVVKYGGAAMEDMDLCKQVVADLELMKLVGMRVVLVHGGGKAINRLLDKLALPVSFKDGLRVTDDAAMRAVQMALVGEVNQMLVAQVNAYGDYGVSITGADGRTLEAVPISPDLGRVGKVEKVNTHLIEAVLDDGYIPVIATVGWAPSGAYNINADLAASEIAIALHADKLIYLSDVDGLYRDFSDKDSLLSSLTLTRRELIDSGTLERHDSQGEHLGRRALEAGVRDVPLHERHVPAFAPARGVHRLGIGTMFKQD